MALALISRVFYPVFGGHLSLTDKINTKKSFMCVSGAAILVFFCAFSCMEKPEREPMQHNHVIEATKAPQIDTLKCIRLSEDSIDQATVLLVQDINTFLKSLVVKIGDRVLCRQILPNSDDYSGFAINWMKKTHVGFSLSIEYGTRYYHEQEFLFELRGRSVSLISIQTKSFDKHENSGNFVPKQVIESMSIPIESFDMKSHMKR